MSDKTWEQVALCLGRQPDRQKLVQAWYYDDPLPGAAKHFLAREDWTAVKPLLSRAMQGTRSYGLTAIDWQVITLEPDSHDLIGAVAIRHLYSFLAVKTS